MGRPYVNINRNNISEKLLKHLDGVLPGLKSLPGVVGITLNGGISRGYADHLSEIDVTIYLDPDTYKRWHEDKSPVPPACFLIVLDRVRWRPGIHGCILYVAVSHPFIFGLLHNTHIAL